VYATIEAAAAALAALLPQPVARPPAAIPAAPPATLDSSYFGARELLAAAGIRFVEARRVSSEQEALEAAREIGYPVVLKALASLHKSDGGGVKVGIADAESLVWEWGDMQQRLVPPECSIEAMAPLSEGVELIVGARRDGRFGPVTMVGLGGVYAELLQDVAVALAPVDQEQAEALLASLRGGAALHGGRGRRPVDIGAAASAAVALSSLAAARPDIAEIEINPLLVTPEGALGLDARVIPAEGGADAG
jgi:succinyl-CoA synthetase beta subunit